MKKIIISAMIFIIFVPVMSFVMLFGMSSNEAIGVLSYPTDYPGMINSGFGIRESPLAGNTEFHLALDLYCVLGDNIYASAPGVVIDSDEYEYGKTIVIEHENGIKTKYVHMDDLLVVEGEEVEAGDVIATCGSTGWSTGPHLHFALIVNNVYMNPQAYLKVPYEDESE